MLLVLLVCLVLAAGFGGLECWEADVCPLVLLPVALLVVDFEDVDFWKMKVSAIVITTVSLISPIIIILYTSSILWRIFSCKDLYLLSTLQVNTVQLISHKTIHIHVGNSMISSDISKLLYTISRAVRQVKVETILKYHEWYLCQISHTNHAIICLYYYLQKVCNFLM